MYEALGWSDVRGGGTCNEIPNGEQRCFRATTKRGPDGISYGPEEAFARRQGCVPSGDSCLTSPAQNPGAIYCCPEGWPRAPGDTRGGFPPAPPRLQDKFVFYSQYWWFWAILVGAPVVAYLGYKTLTHDQLLELSAGADLGVAGMEAAADVL